jgi:hypothetical protein
MAKISARGASEVARFTVRIPDTGPDDPGQYPTVFVLASDGRVLRRWTAGPSGYSVYGLIKDPAKRTAAVLRSYLERHGWQVVKEGR